MCGINGIIKSGDQKTIDAMNRATSHRGRDATGTTYFPHLVFGHNRLSILDLTKNGSQPMTTKDGRFTIVFNGEIYNFKEIKKELLDKKITFQGTSDTEVLLQAYAVWGPDCIAKLQGMWAFAIFDTLKQTLFLSRDPFGIKPLYLYKDENITAFSSEIRGLLAIPESNKIINEEAVKDIIFTGYILAPKTILKKARSLLPGEVVIIDLEKKSEQSFITKLQATNQKIPTDEQLTDALQTSVEKHLIADVPIGLFFSGGVDSSLLALLLKQLNVSLTAFHVAIEGKQNTIYSKAIAEKTNITVKTIILQKENLPTLFERVFKDMDQPLADSSLIPTYAVSQLAKHDVKVVLSGDGADELFGGYPRSKRLAGLSADIKNNQTKSVINACTEALFSLSPKQYPYRYARAVTKRIKSYNKDTLGAFLTETANATGIMDDSGIRKIIQERLNNRETPDGGLALDRLILLPDMLLLKTDTATMAHSIEGRVPFLDKNLFELVGGVTSSWKIENGLGKAPLRRILSKHLPAELFNRPKEGFGISAPRLLYEQNPTLLTQSLEWYRDNFTGLIPTIDHSITLSLAKGALKEMLPHLGYSYYAIVVLFQFVSQHKLQTERI